MDKFEDFLRQVRSCRKKRDFKNHSYYDDITQEADIALWKYWSTGGRSLRLAQTILTTSSIDAFRRCSNTVGITERARLNNDRLHCLSFEQLEETHRAFQIDDTFKSIDNLDEIESIVSCLTSKEVRIITPFLMGSSVAQTAIELNVDESRVYQIISKLRRITKLPIEQKRLRRSFTDVITTMRKSIDSIECECAHKTIEIKPLEEVIRKHIQSAIAECNNDYRLAARHLGIGRSTLYKYVKSWSEKEEAEKCAV